MRWLVVLCLVACGGSKKEKHEKEIAALRERFDELEKCFVKSNAQPKDFGTAVVFATVAEPPALACDDLARKIHNDTKDLAAKAAVKLDDIPLDPYMQGLPDHKYLAEFCKWFLATQNQIETLAAAEEMPKRQPPRCGFGAAVELMAMPSGLSAKERQFADYRLGKNSLTIIDTDHDTWLFARHDGKAWKVVPSPRTETSGTSISWTDEGAIVVTPETDDAHTLHVLEDTTWSQGAKLAPDSGSIRGLAVTKTGVTMVVLDNDKNLYDVRWSTDGAKTFSKPLKLPVAKRWNLAPRVRADGTVIGLMTPHEGPAEFEGFVIAQGDKQATTTTKLAWSEPGNGYFPESCGDDDIVWAIVRDRHLIVSRDAGKTWSKVEGIAENLSSKAVMNCSTEQFGLYDELNKRFYICDATKCTGFARPEGKFGQVGIRLGTPTELWLSSEFGQVHFQEGGAIQVLVYRVEGDKLVPDRVHVIETAGKLPVVRDKDRYLLLRAH